MSSDNVDNRWSGLAPAVDAHLARWHLAHRNVGLAELARTATDVPAIRNFLNTLWGQRWMVFAMTYGVQDENGVPKATLAVVDGQTIVGREQYDADETAMRQGAFLAIREHKMLHQATSHYVSASVMQEVTEAADELGPEPLFHTDLFCPHGFAVFEEPFVAPDLDPATGEPHPTLKVHVRAMGWAVEPQGILSMKTNTVEPGISVFLYTSHEDYANGYYRTAVEAGFTPEPPEDFAAETGLIPVEVLPWAYGVDWSVRYNIGNVPGEMPMTVAYQRRWFLAFQRLMWQEVIVRRWHRPARAEQRRWEHMAKRKELLDYTVLRLRREVDPNYEYAVGTGQPLKHRVKVRGHWRHQYYPSLGPARMEDGSSNPDSHRMVWIEAYWKGPEDGPLGAMHSATSVTR